MEIIVSGEKSYYIQPKRKSFAEYMLQSVKGNVTVVDNKMCIRDRCRSEKNDKIIATATANFMILD